MKIVGYADRFSVAPGEVIRFMVSCELHSYQAEIVRLIHGDVNPAGPGFKEQVLQTTVRGTYAGRSQPYRHGSYVRVPDSPVLRELRSFTISLWLYPTTPALGVQGLLGTWSPDKTGFALGIDETGALALWLGAGGDVEHISTEALLQAGTWYFGAASYDAETGRVLLVQRPARAWP